MVLQYASCIRSSSDQCGHSPSGPAGLKTSLLRVVMPESHSFEHGVHSDHSGSSSQGLSQASTLHSIVSDRSPHGSPPCSASVIALRMRLCMPPPQSFEQMPYSDHSSTTQSIGHGCMLHASFSIMIGHSAPPFDAGVTTWRVIVSSPPPHSTLHSPGIHSPTSQSSMKGL